MATDPYAQTSPAYQPYMDSATKMYAPLRQASNESFRAALADKGLLGSTGAIGAQAQNDSAWVQKIKEWADTRWQNERAFREGQRQFNQNYSANQQQFGTNAALQLWEMLMSGALSKEQLQGNNSNVSYPNQIQLFKDIFSQRFLAPAASKGPVGDPKVDTVSMYKDPFTKTLAARQEERVASDADADRALTAQRLQFEMDQAAKATENDPYAVMAADARDNYKMGLAQSGSNLLPSQQLENWAAEFGLDWARELTGPNAMKAKALIKSLYPNDPMRAEAVIRRLSGLTPTAIPSPATDQPDSSGSWWDRARSMHSLYESDPQAWDAKYHSSGGLGIKDFVEGTVPTGIAGLADVFRRLYSGR